MRYDQGESCLLHLPRQLSEELAPLYGRFLSLIENSDRNLKFDRYPTDRETLGFLQGLDSDVEWGPLVPSLTEMADQAARNNDSRFVGNFHDG